MMGHRVNKTSTMRNWKLSEPNTNDIWKRHSRGLRYVSFTCCPRFDDPNEAMQAEAMEVHSQDLHAHRTNFDATTAQLRAQSDSAMQALKDEHADILENSTRDMQKQLNKLNVELKATQDDLNKAKAASEAIRADLASVTAQRDEARASASAAPKTSPEHLAELESLKRELSHTKDDLAAVTDMLNLTKSSIEEMSNKHSIALEEAATARAQEATQLRAEHDGQLSDLAKQKADLLTQLSDLEGELATLKATVSSAAQTPKTNGTTPAQPSVDNREELQKLHEAHNLKINDVQAEHAKAIRALEEKLEEAAAQNEKLQADVDRKIMELKYMEDDQEESQEQIIRYVLELFQCPNNLLSL